MGLIRSCRSRKTAGWLLFGLLIATCAAAGCTRSGAPVAHLSGTVSLDGQPIPAGSFASISFQPASSNAVRATSAEIIDSRYECANVPQGSVRATVHMSIPTGRTLRDDRTGQNTSELENVVLDMAEAGGIELDVTGDATVDFDLHRANRQKKAK